MVRRIAVGGLLLAAGLGLTACSGSGDGNVFASAGSTTASEAGASTSSGGSSAAQQLAAIQPCSLITSSVMSQNGLRTDGGAGNLAGARMCKWQQPTGTDSNGNSTGYTVGVGIRDSQGLADINTDGYTETNYPINGRPADLLTSTVGLGCTLALSVTSGSRVDVITSASSGDTNYACQVAVQYAKVIEPELPGGSH